MTDGVNGYSVQDLLGLVEQKINICKDQINTNKVTNLWTYFSQDTQK